MINCIICDDQKEYSETVRAMAQKEFDARQLAVKLSAFTDPTVLMIEVQSGKPADIAILDIEMEPYSGQQIAKEIKKHNPDCCIIFLTSFTKYAISSYELQIFRYLLKDDMEQKLPRYINEAIDYLGKTQDRTFLVENVNGMRRISCKKILYVYKDSKYSVICCEGGIKHRVRKSIETVFAELGEEEFVLVDRGCLVSLSKITGMSAEGVKCTDGAILPVSRNKFKHAKETIAEYWSNRL